MVEVAAHMVENVFPRLPVRQWVLSFPKRLRYFLQHDAVLAGRVLRVFLLAVESKLRAATSAASPSCSASVRHSMPTSTSTAA